MKYISRAKPLMLWFQSLLLLFILAFGLFISPAKATGVYDLPILSPGSPTWVIDQAEVISRVNEGALGNALANLAKKTGNEVRMIAIRRLDYDQTIDSFSDALFNKWFPTPEDRSNQTIVVMDTLTNNVAMRTGEAVQETLPNDIAESIVEETIQGALREGSLYNKAFLEAKTRLVAVLSGEVDPGPPAVKEINVEGTFATAEETDDRSATIWVVVLLLLATAIPMATYFFYVGFD